MTASHLITVIYSSRAVRPFSGQELLEMLKVARERNAQNGITGLLLYKNAEFMQALEGQETPVLALVERIARDPRHTSMIVFYKAAIDQRFFANWAMGFAFVDEIAPQVVGAMLPLLNEPLASDYFIHNPQRTHDFLASMRGSLI